MEKKSSPLSPLSPRPRTHVHVHLPASWRELSIEQLEQVARILIDNAREYNICGHYSLAKLFTQVFFALTDLRIITTPDAMASSEKDNADQSPASRESLKPEERYYDCEFSDPAVRKARQEVNGKIIPIRIYVEEIAAMTCLNPIGLSPENKPRYATGGLTWLLSPCDIIAFPYPKLSITDPDNPKAESVEFEGPMMYLSNFPWRQFRNACDFLSHLTKLENMMVRLEREQALNASNSRLHEHKARLDRARAMWLATIFNREIQHIDRETGQSELSFYYTSSQSADNMRFFTGFSEARYQVILLWWQGMMHRLAKRYPKVFRSEKVASEAPEDALMLYTRSTTTMIKYAQSNEEEVNRTTYSIILQHINDMAEENERLKQITSHHGQR